MIRYPLNIHHMECPANGIIKDPHLIAHFAECHIIGILSEHDLQVIQLAHEHARMIYEISLKNWLVSGNKGIHFDQVFKFEIRFGIASSYVYAVAIEAGYNHEAAKRLAAVMMWDRTDTMSPKYTTVAEEIIINNKKSLNLSAYSFDEAKKYTEVET